MTWQDDAACLTEDPELWHDYAHDALWSPAAPTEKTRRAKAICTDCPVKQQCLNAALKLSRDGSQIESAYGIFGGLDAAERWALLNGNVRPPVRAKQPQIDLGPDDTRHGTRTGYRYGCRCEECSAAQAEAARRWAANKKAEVAA